MSESNVWRSRWNEAAEHFLGVVLLSVIYLASELNIWGLSLALAPAQLQYFASILSMVLVFSAMTLAGRVSRTCDGLYRRWIKKNVDVLNAQLGVGFSIPIIMLDHMLSLRDIGYIVATSAITNVVSWIGVFLLSLAGLSLLSASQSYLTGLVRRRAADEESTPSSQSGEKQPAAGSVFHPYQRPSWKKYLTLDDAATTTTPDDDPSSSSPGEQRPTGVAAETNASSSTPVGHPGKTTRQDRRVWRCLRRNGYLITCLVGIVALGVPLQMTLADSRALDGFALWLCWITAIRLQRMVKHSVGLIVSARGRHTLATMMNPVLVTTALMLGYTRLRGALNSRDGGVAVVLGDLSSGTPLYSLWTALARSAPLPDNPRGWFGAGDLALSLLECGIVAWGFKLYECRRQLFSPSGLVIFLFCSVAAAGNVFLPVLLASALGLDGPEALAFAARSTTLALAKPAVKTLGGNLALNASLVVSNGIIGQLLYPLLLEKLSIPASDPSVVDDDGARGPDAKGDDIRTVAAGTAIGINGAAMGVSYLYEVRSRAAPYAVLSMTIFGVMTVAFTTLEPFKGVILGLASR
ncbi:hypothetical protein E4U42_001769 [Claviceps africana]|uniref:LrgB-like protein n=1 Tax=Claviceps africana TaxID=83212 RepID=A0A8K0J969_9HYPO|nr:hypothetical protein E4U42_001769 [Claviceps africana]